MFARVGSFSWDVRGLRLAALLSFAVWLVGCSSSGHYIWVQSVPIAAEVAQPPVVISAGDLLDVRVYNEERLSSKARVRPDGMIVLPLLGDVPVVGKAPAQLARELQERWKNFLQAPSITVELAELHAQSFTIVGEIGRPGVFPLPYNTGLLQALALGGGLTQFADPDAIYVLRRDPVQRYRVTYEQLTHNEPHAIAFQVMDGDVIVVE